AERNASLVKRALDIGADGILVPWIETADELRELVSFAHYPPRGVRGIGAERATGWGQCIGDHVRKASENVLIVPIIESVRGGKNIHTLLGVEGVDLFFFGPADYSSSAGFAGQWEGPGVAEQLLHLKDAVVSAGKQCGLMTTSEADLQRRREQGFRMLGIGSDSGLLIRGLHAALAATGRDRRINTAFTPMGASVEAPLDRPPESFRPNRSEVMTELGAGKKVEIQPGVVFDALVGAHNGAKNLTTGIVRLHLGRSSPITSIPRPNRSRCWPDPRL
ncbi:MAG TPA: aldolase/citrate lyase family protein, partial [Lacipirellulaceae bacterium]|nr:aldolase/citrate lyase family protein [Lacipirellulaceae bacterium]